MRRLFLCLPVLLLATQLLLAQTSLYRVDTIAGGTEAGDGGAATSALLIQAQGLVLDSKHRLYIADATDNRVRRIDADGTIETIAGTGLAGSRGDGWWASQAELRNPYGLAIDSQDNLYIADLGNSKIRKVTASGIITTLAGGGMVVPGGTNDGGPGTDYLLGAPRNLTFDPQGHLFVSDFSRNQVYEISPDGTLVTAAGTGTAGHSDDFGAAHLAELDARRD